MRTLWAWSLLAALALPARADIVDSGALTIGGQGVVGGTFTVQGNALGVAGSVSAASATLSGSGANTFTLTTSSGMHILAGGITWPDGTTSATGFKVVNATFTTIRSLNSTTSSSWISVSNATVTLTANGYRLFMHFACDLTQASSGFKAYGGFLVNGQLIDGETATTGFTTATRSDGPTTQIAGQWQHLTESAYSGSVSVVPIFRTETNSTAWVNAYGDSACQMAVWEVR